MRRQLLTTSQFGRGYNDSVEPLSSDPSTFAAGSCNLMVLGENVQRPFGGLTGQGAGSGTGYACQFGADWGGLKPYSSVAGKGSQLSDYSSTLFVIGSGYASKLGANLTSGTNLSTFTSAAVNTGTGNLNIPAHGLTAYEPVYLTTTGTLPLGLSVSTAYFVIIVDANNIKLASSYANAVGGTAITGGTTGTGTQSLRSGNNIIATSLLQVGSNLNAGYVYTYLDTAGLAQAVAPTVIVPSNPSAPYTGFINGAVNFKIAAIRDRQNMGVNIDNPAAPVKGRASSATVVVVPNNKTVKITFPTAQTGQTHWAVFSTKEGFGGTGEFYRVGWRSSSDVAAVWYFGISETTVAAATGRTLEFDYRTGDLLPETAWLEDFPPQPGTHCVRIENIMMVFGSSDGTVAQVSLPGFFESYNPFHLLYFPEPVTAVLHRQVDDFAVVACRNSIHAVQYVGYRGGELPPATVTTITPDIGIAYQSNWALGGGQICAYIEGTGLVMMTSGGEIDFEFGREVERFTSQWTASGTVVGFDPSTRSFVAACGNETVSFCLQTGVWSTPIYIADANVSGTAKSAINSNGSLYISLESGGVVTAYKWDGGGVRMPVCAIGQWQSAPLGRSVQIYEAASAIQQGANTEPAIIGLHTNLFKPYLRSCSVSNGSSTLTSSLSGAFTTAYTGKQAVVFGTNIGGAGVHYIICKLSYLTGTTAQMLDRTTGAPINASASASNLFVLVGRDFFTLTPGANAEQFLLNVRPSLQNVRSWCVSTFLATDAVTGNIYGQSVFGTGSESSVVNVG